MSNTTKDVTAAIWIEAGRVLVARRPVGPPQGGQWEFPGGKIEPHETPEACLQRELREELGVDVTVGPFFAESLYPYANGTIRLLAYRVHRAAPGDLHRHVHDELRWVTAAELDAIDFLPADIPLARLLVTSGLLPA